MAAISAATAVIASVSKRARARISVFRPASEGAPSWSALFFAVKGFVLRQPGSMLECSQPKRQVMKREILTTTPEKSFLGVPVERKSFEEIIDFFARGPSPAEVLAFRPSEESEERVRDLLERNGADELTAEEAEELECFGEVEHFVQLVKVRARAYVEKKT